ncbi:MAG TPA: response regulator [Bdellovibrionales bacterium]|nr:response regulator [Bdellovibrionales bacterium]
MMKAHDERPILLVEDNVDDEELTLRALRKNNIKNEVIVVRDGEEALDYLFARGKFSHRNSKEIPQVMLLDLKLPRLSGLDVLAQVRASEITKLVPVVILTSSKEDQDLIEGYAHGANSYVRKPVDFSAFMDAVRQLGIYWLMLNESAPLRR